MKPSNRKMVRTALPLVCGALLCSLNAARAQSDKEMAEMALKAREHGQDEAMDHSGHAGPGRAAGQFRGVFYGYLPCDEADCDGIKMTLSLNAKDRYLLVIQPAKPQNRESFEKGQYQWDDAQGLVVLSPNNKEAPQRRFAIKDEGSLLFLSADGKSLSGDQDRYLLQRSDKAGNREMHIH